MIAEITVQLEVAQIGRGIHFASQRGLKKRPDFFFRSFAWGMGLREILVRTRVYQCIHDGVIVYNSFCDVIQLWIVMLLHHKMSLFALWSERSGGGGFCVMLAR